MRDSSDHDEDRRYGQWAHGHLRLATRAEAPAQNVVVCPVLCNYNDCPGPAHPAGQENNYLHSKYTRGHLVIGDYS